MGPSSQDMHRDIIHLEVTESVEQNRPVIAKLSHADSGASRNLNMSSAGWLWLVALGALVGVLSAHQLVVEMSNHNELTEQVLSGEPGTSAEGS